jgi:hypothetical protein
VRANDSMSDLLRRDEAPRDDAMSDDRPFVSPSHHSPPCDVCGSFNLSERHCKVVCLNCRTIIKSCADL